MHGKDAVVEEILDWRPYDYLTDRSTVDTPMGPIKMLSTLELEPTATGTILHWRFAAPKTARERAIMEQLGPMFRSLFEQSRQTLAAQLESELAVRTADVDLQPALPRPRADGLFSEMPQLQMVG
jgi:hypothetical protein